MSMRWSARCGLLVVAVSSAVIGLLNGPHLTHVVTHRHEALLLRICIVPVHSTVAIPLCLCLYRAVAPCAASSSSAATAASARQWVSRVNLSLPEASNPGYADFVAQGYVARNHVLGFDSTLSAQNKEDYANSVLFASFACTNTREPDAKPPTPIVMQGASDDYYQCYNHNMNAIGWSTQPSKVTTRKLSSQQPTLALDMWCVISSAFGGPFGGMAYAALASLQETDDGAYSLYHAQSQLKSDNQFQLSSVSSNGFVSAYSYFTHFTNAAQSYQVLWANYTQADYSYTYYAQQYQQTPAVWDDEFRQDIRNALGSAADSYVKNKNVDTGSPPSTSVCTTKAKEARWE